MKLKRMRPTVPLAALLLVVVLSGCGSHTSLQPMPVIYGPGRADLCSLIPESKRTSELQVFYATNRAAKGPANNREYTNKVDERLRLGVATVQMGNRDATWDEICRASSGKGGNPVMRMTRAAEFGRLGDASADAFVEAIDRQLALSNNRQVNVYIHGFRTNVDLEVEVLAKLAHCSGRRGAFVCFAWPSRQSLFLYGQDVRRGKQSAHHLADLLELIAGRTQAERINLLGYSCGAAAMTEALVQLRNRYPDATPEELSHQLRIGNVILAASDIDLKTFARSQLVRLQDLAENVVIYIADNDAALGLASFGYGASRLGRPNVAKLNLTQAQLEEAARDTSLQVVDVSDVPGKHASGGGFGGHGYWYANSWIMTDLLVDLRWQIPAAQRGLVRRSGKARWYFPKDYPARVTEAVRRQLRPATTLPTSPATTRAVIASRQNDHGATHE
jgi:esterase/lipase superfamily enzyme